MSFDFSNINPPMKAGAAYKDGSGMGGGGMYFQQGKNKRKDQPEEDLFELKKDENETDVLFPEFDGDVPRDNVVNKFVNWFRLNKD